MWKGGWWMECDMLHAKRVVGRMWLLVVGCCGLWSVERRLCQSGERDAARVTDVADCWRRERERAARVVMAERTFVLILENTQAPTHFSHGASSRWKRCIRCQCAFPSRVARSLATGICLISFQLAARCG